MNEIDKYNIELKLQDLEERIAALEDTVFSSPPSEEEDEDDTIH